MKNKNANFYSIQFVVIIVTWCQLAIKILYFSMLCNVDIQHESKKQKHRELYNRIFYYSYFEMADVYNIVQYVHISQFRALIVTYMVCPESKETKSK